MCGLGCFAAAPSCILNDILLVFHNSFAELLLEMARKVTFIGKTNGIGELAHREGLFVKQDGGVSQAHINEIFYESHSRSRFEQAAEMSVTYAEKLGYGINSKKRVAVIE